MNTEIAFGVRWIHVIATLVAFGLVLAAAALSRSWIDDITGFKERRKRVLRLFDEGPLEHETGAQWAARVKEAARR